MFVQQYKLDRREWFANPRDGTGMVYIITGSYGNGTSGTGRNGTGFHFHSRVPIYCGCSKYERLMRFAKCLVKNGAPSFKQEVKVI